MKLNNVYLGTLGTYVSCGSTMVDTEEVKVYFNPLRRHFVDIDTGVVYPVVDQSMVRPCRGLVKESLVKVTELSAEAETTKNYVKVKRMKKSWYIK